MRTYAESKGKPPFDWNRFLSLRQHTTPQLLLAQRIASSWVTCACGNQCDVIPRRDYNPVGAPEDAELFRLGLRFSVLICKMATYAPEKRPPVVIEAQACLAAIEARSAELILSHHTIHSANDSSL